MKLFFKKLVLITTITCVLLTNSLSTLALNYDMTTGNPGSGSFSANGSYKVTYDGNKAVGYRFSIVSSSGDLWEGYDPVDIYRADRSDYMTANHFRFIDKLPKTLLRYEYQFKGIHTKKFQDNNSALDSDTRLNFSLPSSTTDIKSFLTTDIVKKILALRGWTTSDLSTYKYAVLVEPIYAVTLEGQSHALTVSEIAAYGAFKFGGNAAPADSGTQGTWNYISKQTNLNYPNSLMFSSTYFGMSGGTTLTSVASFSTILNKGYGAGIISASTINTSTVWSDTYTVWYGDIDPEEGKVTKNDYDADGWVVGKEKATYGKGYAIEGIGRWNRRGHTFAGWTTNKNGTDDGYSWTGWEGTWKGYNGKWGIGYDNLDDPRATNISHPNELWLYTMWEPIEYTVYYYNTNPETGSVTPADEWEDPDKAVYGEDYTVEGIGSWSREGYTFAGWTTDGENLLPDENPWVAGKKYDPWKWIDGEYGIGKEEKNALYLYAMWEPVEYTVKYDANGGTEAPEAQTKLHGTDLTITNATPINPGYTFIEWNTEADGTGISYSSGDTYSANEDVTLYAQWEETDEDEGIIYVFYKGNGATSGNNWVEQVNLASSEGYILSDNTKAFERVEKKTETNANVLFKFMGWQIGDKKYDFGEEVLSDDLLANVEILSDGTTKVVYIDADWDEYPVIEAVDRYFSLDDVQNGKITLSELLLTADAIDGEIGDVTDFGAGDGTFTVINFDVGEFKKFTTTGSVTVTYQAIDNVGNEAYRTVTIYIVDKNKKHYVSGDDSIWRTRFVGSKYYKNTDGSYVPEADGGLNAKSIWINVFEYEKALTETLKNKRNSETGKWNKVYHTWSFTKDQVSEAKAYIEEHGLGNSRESDALAKFYEKFKPDAT